MYLPGFLIRLIWFRNNNLYEVIEFEWLKCYHHQKWQYYLLKKKQTNHILFFKSKQTHPSSISMAMHVSAYLSKYARHYLKCYFKKWRFFLWNSIPFLTVWMSPNLKKRVNSSSKLCIFFNQIVYFLLFFFFWWGWGGGVNSLQYVDYLILRYFSFIRIFYYLTCSIYLTKN